MSKPSIPKVVWNYSDLSHEELKDIALEKGYTLSGDETPEKLIEMLTGESAQAQEPQAKVEKVAKAPTPKKPAIQDAELIDTETLPGVQMDKEFYKQYFAKSPKVRVIIPLGIGEKPHTDSSGKIHYPVETCSINGYAISIRKGVYVNVPEEFATIIENYTNFQVDSPVDLATADNDTLQALQ